MARENSIEIAHYRAFLPHALRWRGSSLRVIWPKIIILSLWATLIALIDRYATSMRISNSLIPILGLVVSLLVAFRTNTAYDRYWEGRRLWGTLVVNCRHLVRYIWVGLPSTEPKDQVEKASAIRLLIAFAVATKHYLRDEYGPHYPDLEEYLRHIPKFNNPAKVIPTRGGGGTRKGKRGEKKNEWDGTNLPLEIILYLASFTEHQKALKNIDAPLFTLMSNATGALVDCLTGFERILRSPIPLAYSVHLSQVIWLYCLALPFQLLGSIGWVTIPVVGITGFTLLGIESMGGEIENPFGYDANDLPLDDFCRVLRLEIDAITAVAPPRSDDWVFTNVNLAFLKRRADEQAEETRIRSEEIEREASQAKEDASKITVMATAMATATGQTDAPPPKETAPKKDGGGHPVGEAASE